MQGIGSILKLFGVLTLGVVLVALYFLVIKVQEDFGAQTPVPQERLEQLIDATDLPDFEPGQKEFHRALELIATGQLDQALEKLSLIQKLHPNSQNGPEARRILGEINLDRLLNIENMTNKKRHLVKSGDSFFKIARDYETTLDNIMFLNGLLDTSRLHPGDDLIVMPLNFQLVFDSARERIELHLDGALVKEYPAQKLDLPRLPKRSLKSKISLKVAELRGRPYRPTHPNYRRGIKVLGFKVRSTQIQIRPVPKVDEEDPGRGIFLSFSDMEELSMLIRRGNEVEIKPAG